MASPKAILIVCHANTSRSIIAEALLKKMFVEHALEGRFAVRSGGIAPYARDGALVSMDARFALRDAGVDIPPEAVSTDLKRNRHLVSGADLILAMTVDQVRILGRSFPESWGKEVHTLRGFAGFDGDIEDPAGQETSVFAARRDEIKWCLQRAVARLAREEVRLSEGRPLSSPLPG